MSTRIRFTAAIIAGILAIICFQSCSDRIVDPGPPEFRFSIQGLESDGLNLILVFNDPVTDSVLIVRKILQSGTYDFGNSLPPRATLTFFREAQNRLISINSWKNAPAATYSVDYGVPHDTLGTAEISLTFPAVTRWSYCIVLPSTSMAGYDPSLTDTLRELHVSIPVMRFNPTQNFSVWAWVDGNPDSWCGWIDNQPFQANRTNAYALNLNQPVATRTVTLNRPITEFVLGLSYGPYSGYSYISTGSPQSGGTSVTMQVPNSPQRKYWLAAFGRASSCTFSFEQEVNAFPSDWTIPEGGIQAAIDSEMFRSVQATGSADVISGYWRVPSDFGYSYWTMTADPQSTQLSLPRLPDSLRSRFAPDSVAFTPAFLAMDDYEPLNGYDSYLAMMFSPDFLVKQKYTQFYSFSCPAYALDSVSVDQMRRPFHGRY
jgi:hypothetical protein